ncbi:MAG: hypothetical protein AB1664_08985 [Thermodesulfobacteriota bacterium]
MASTHKLKSHGRGNCLAFLLLFLGLLAAHLWLLWSSRLLPFIDLPDHLATATILRHYGEPTNQFAEYYSISSFFWKPNLFHILFCSSSLFPSVEFANKIFYSIYVILLPLSVLLLIRTFQGNPWYSLLSFLLMYNLSVSWGFAGFTISIPLFLLVSYLFIRYLERPNVRIASILAAAFVFLFFVHALMVVFAISAFAICCLVRRGNSPRAVLGCVAVVIPIIVVMIVWWNQREVSQFAGPGFVSSLAEYYRDSYLHSLPGRIRLALFDNYFLYDGLPGKAIALIFFHVIILLLVPLLKAPKATLGVLREPGKPDPVPLLVLLGWTLFCFLVLPDQVFNFQILYPRFSVVFLALVIVTGSIIHSARRVDLRIAIICLVCVAHLVLWADYFRDFQKENAQFTRSFFPADSNRKTLGGLVYDIDFRGKPIYVHCPSYYIVWTQGVATFRIVDFVDFAPPVRRKEGGRSISDLPEWAWASRSFDPARLNVDYLLIRGNPNDLSASSQKLYRLVRAAEKWLLYEKKAPSG